MARPTHIKLSIMGAAFALVCAGIIMLSGTFASNVNYKDTTDAATVSGNYNVVLQSYTKDSAVPPVDIITKDGMVPDANFTKDMFWCPGRTEIIYLKLENNEAFPVNCTLKLSVSESGFGNTLSYAVMPGLKAGDALPANWDAFVNNAGDVTGVLKNTKSSDQAYALHKGYIELSPAVADGEENVHNDEAYLALAIHMDHNASNDYQEVGMKLQFFLQVDANSEPINNP